MNDDLTPPEAPEASTAVAVPNPITDFISEGTLRERISRKLLEQCAGAHKLEDISAAGITLAHAACVLTEHDEPCTRMHGSSYGNERIEIVRESMIALRRVLGMIIDETTITYSTDEF